MERKGMKEFSNGLTSMVQEENYTADGLTAENQLAKDTSADLPEQLIIVKRYQLNGCTLLLVMWYTLKTVLILQF